MENLLLLNKLTNNWSFLKSNPVIYLYYYIYFNNKLIFCRLKDLKVI